MAWSHRKTLINTKESFKGQRKLEKQNGCTKGRTYKTDMHRPISADVHGIKEGHGADVSGMIRPLLDRPKY